MLWTPGFFLEIFHQTWISEELGNRKTCTFLWEGEVKRGTRRKERSLLREGMGQGGGGAQWARGDRLGGPGGWTVTLGAGPCPVQPSVQNRALKVGDQGQRSCEGVLNSGTQRPANVAWRTPTLPRHVLLPTQSLEHPGPLLTAEPFFPTGTGPPRAAVVSLEVVGQDRKRTRPQQRPQRPTPPPELSAQPKAGPAFSALDLPAPGEPSSTDHCGSAAHVCVSRSVASDSSRPHGLYSARLLCPWGSPGKNTGVGCHARLQKVCSHPGIEPGSPTLQADSLPSEPPGKPQGSVGWTRALLLPPSQH